MDKTILTQKIKNPQTQEWIETFYINQSEQGGVLDPPRIYYKGKLADSNAVSSRNLDWSSIINLVPLTTTSYRLQILNN